MKRRLFVFSLLTGTTMLFAVRTTIGQAAGAAVPDHYIVTLAPGANAKAVLANHGLAPTLVYSAVFNGFAGFIPPGRVRALQNDPRVMAVTQDRVVSVLGKPSGGGSGTTTEVVPAGINRIGAFPAPQQFTGTGVGVAVVDTGIDLSHRDLIGTDSSTGNSLLVSLPTTLYPSAQDDNGHGTHVAGTIAARDNDVDVIGVAPNATLYAVKVLDASGSGSDASVIGGLDAVLNANVSPPIRVVNMSLGRPASSDDSAMHAAVQRLYAANITVVVAAGNDCSLEVSQQVPAGFREVLAVASTTALTGTSADARFSAIVKDSASYFTTDGKLDSLTGVGVTISSPGEDQENIKKGGLLQSVGILSTKLGGGTTRMSGTSMASPHVAGVVALLYQQANGSLRPEDARAKLRNGAELLGSTPVDGRTGCYSYDGEKEGILSAPRALAAP